MKHIKNLLWAAMAVVLLSLGGCKEVPEEIGEPGLTLQQSELTVPGEGGNFTLTYTIENPVADTEIKYTVTKDWVYDVDLSVEGKLSFSVKPSYEKEGRSCIIELTYPGVYPNPTLTIKQPEGLKHSIELTVKKITAGTVYLDVIPQDKDMPYLLLLGKKSYMEQDGTLEDDAKQVESDLEVIENFGAAFGATIDQVIGAFMYVGDQIDHRWGGVESNTEYVAYAYGFDVRTMQPTTEICRVDVVTPAVDMYKVNFDLSVNVDGPEVDFTIQPQGYDGHYFFGVFDAASCPKGTDPETMFVYCDSAWEEEKSWYSSFFDTPEQGLHFIFNELAYTGKAELSAELAANTEYVLWAAGMDDQAMLNTEPVVLYFTTGGARTSQNEFTITVSDIRAREAVITVTTTTNDPYVAVITTPTRFEGYTNDEIMNEVCTSWNYSLIEGDMTTSATGLSPSTTYELLVFGVDGGAPSTGLTRQTFTTADPVDSTAAFELKVGNYYDIDEIIALDPDWSSYAGEDMLVPISAIYDAAQVKNVFFGVSESDKFREYTEDVVVEALLSEGPCDPTEYYLLEYNVEYIFFGVAEDNDGNLTPLYKSKYLTFKESGTSPAQEFLDSIAQPQSAPLKVAGFAPVEHSPSALLRVF